MASTTTAGPLVHHRSKTILLVVHEVQDVAPAAAMCALMGDLYRHRTHFSKEPMVVLRVAVRNHLRHCFVHPKGDSIVVWRGHECANRSARWITHVGAPDSIWSLEDDGLVEAFWGRRLRHPLSQDDGGMADMILVGPSANSLTLWQNLAQLVQSMPSHYHDSAPPLLIATLGSLRGVDWVSRMAFALQKGSNTKEKDPRRKRSIALVGFPSSLWYCRVVSNSASANAKKIRTQYSQENSVVLMIGNRDSSSDEDADVSLITTPGTTPFQTNQVFQLLRQSIFPPKTHLDIMPPPMSLSSPQSSKPYIYNLLWSLLQDPHMIQFPCYMANSRKKGPTATPTKSQTLGALILSTLEEVIWVLRGLHLDLARRHQQQDPAYDDAFCQAIMHPLEESLLAKLLGTGGSLVEDLTNNRRTEVLARLKRRDDAALHQRWILEPLATRTALAEWYLVTQHSPFSSGPADGVLVQQLAAEHVAFGLGMVLQLGDLLELSLPSLRWVVERVDHVPAIPLQAWGIRSMDDLYNFLVRQGPLGEEAGIENVTRLLSRL